MIVSVLPVFIGLTAGNAVTPPDIRQPQYRVTLTIDEQHGPDQTTTTAINVVPLADGPVSAGSAADGATPLLSGNLRVDEVERTAVANLTICRPRREVCEQVARPSLAFSIGNAASFYVGAPEFSVKVEFAPHIP